MRGPQPVGRNIAPIRKDTLVLVLWWGRAWVSFGKHLQKAGFWEDGEEGRRHTPWPREEGKAQRVSKTLFSELLHYRMRKFGPERAGD